MQGIVLIQLGSPASPKVSDVREFLRKFLGDPRVVDYKSVFWKILLHGIILPFRPRKVAKAYESIWKDGTFPLFRHTANFSAAVQNRVEELGRKDILVEHAYLISTPSVVDSSRRLLDRGCKRIKYVFQFPQYSEATTLSAMDVMHEALKQLPAGLDYEIVKTFHDCPAYIDSMVERIDASLAENKVDKLVLSFHGYPLRRIFAGDDYFKHCTETAQLLAARLKNIRVEDVVVSFQSKFGREDWLTPSTESVIQKFNKDGVKRIAVSCPAFTVDNLETDEEIDIGLRETFMEGGGEFFAKVPCLNDHPTWVRKFTDEIVLNPADNIPTYAIPVKPVVTIPVQKYKSEPLSPQAKVSIKSVFIVLFLDLIGFSIIFPLFPKMLEYYQKADGQAGLFAWSMQKIHALAELTGGSGTTYHIVLFGGILGALYSFLQFLCAPFIGSLSDRIGRKPVLVFSIAGMVISYILWFFSGSFLTLVISRILGGVMSGNISTATAVVADVTTGSNRSKGMSTIGIAFGMGFVFGPAIGGFAAEINLLDWFPGLSTYGVNPFSTPALIACLLSIFNLFYVTMYFKESLNLKNSKGVLSNRIINPLRLFRTEQYPGVTLNNMVYFFFLFAFSGMEFTLTFLTAERFDFDPIHQGMMFLYIGTILAFMQGGYVRRKARQVGEQRMASRGFMCVLPALIIIGLAPASHPFLLFVGLFLLAVGSAQVMPCLTSLASIYAPEHEQGRILGIFRSLGALSRVLGPLVACFLYWKFGGTNFYIIGGLFMLLPFLLLRKMPANRLDAAHP